MNCLDTKKWISPFSSRNKTNVTTATTKANCQWWSEQMKLEQSEQEKTSIGATVQFNWADNMETLTLERQEPLSSIITPLHAELLNVVSVWMPLYVKAHCRWMCVYVCVCVCVCSYECAYRHLLVASCSWSAGCVDVVNMGQCGSVWPGSNMSARVTGALDMVEMDPD